MARYRCKRCLGTEFNLLVNKKETRVECRNCLLVALRLPTQPEPQRKKP